MVNDNRSPSGGFNQVYQTMGCPSVEEQMAIENTEEKPDFSNQIEDHTYSKMVEKQTEDLGTILGTQAELEECAEEGEYWVLQINNGELDPVMYAGPEETLVDPDFAPEDGFMQLTYLDTNFENHPTAILEESEYLDEFSDNLRGCRSEEIDSAPELESFDGLNQEEVYQGSFIAPGTNWM